MRPSFHDVPRGMVYQAGIAALALGLLAGCSPADGQASLLVGVWQQEAGTVFADQVDGQVWGLAVQEGGTAEVFTRDPGTGVLGHYGGTYSLTGTSLFAQFPAFRDHAAQMYAIERLNANNLELSNAAGATSTFIRVQTVLYDMRRRTFSEAVCLTSELPTPSIYTGLGFDYERLWYKGQDTTLLYSVDPSNGRVSGLIDATVFEGLGSGHVQAMQGARFWMSYVGTEARCYTPTGGLADVVRTGADLGREILVVSMAFDPSAQILWIHGWGWADRVWRLLRVNSAAEPDVLLDQHAFAVPSSSMAWDHSRNCLWAVTPFGGQAVIQIEVAGPRVAATYEPPRDDIRWQGVAVVDGGLFLLGSNAELRGLLYRVAP